MRGLRAFEKAVQNFNYRRIIHASGIKIREAVNFQLPFIIKKYFPCIEVFAELFSKSDRTPALKSA
jgi:hypothetical protein